MIDVLLVAVDGRMEPKKIAPDLDGLTALLDGGLLEAIAGDGWSAYCDEEGKIKGLPVNEHATMLARYLGWPVGDVLCGPVVFCGPVDEEGYDTSVDFEFIGKTLRKANAGRVWKRAQ